MLGDGSEGVQEGELIRGIGWWFEVCWRVCLRMH